MKGRLSVRPSDSDQTMTQAPGHPSVAAGDFTRALSGAANSVSIAATDGQAGIAGLTVSSVCSVCAEPPVILACVSQDNEFCDLVSRNQVFSVNMLSSLQQKLANEFAGLGDNPELNRFLQGEWSTLLTGAPILQGTLASLDCELTATHAHGTHNIYIGRVVAITSSNETPLIYTRRAYANLAPQ